MTKEETEALVARSKEGVQRLIAGLAIIAENTIGCSFYNSSGDSIVFRLATALTDAEWAALRDLGFSYNWDKIADRGSVSFPEW